MKYLQKDFNNNTINLLDFSLFILKNFQKRYIYKKIKKLEQKYNNYITF